MEFDATFIIAAISFIVFVFIMNKVLYEPVLNIMKQRQSLVEQNYKEAEETKKITDEKIKYHNNELEISREKARDFISKSSKEIKAAQSKEITNYKNELNSEIAKEKEEMINSALSAKDNLKDTAVDIAKNVSSIILGNTVNNETIDKTKIEEP